MWPHDGVWICRRGLRVRTAVDLQLARPSCVCQKNNFSAYRRLPDPGKKKKKIGWGRSQHPWQQLIAISSTFRGFQLACCAVLCTHSCWKRVETRCAGCWPNSPRGSPAESSVREASTALQKRGTFFSRSFGTPETQQLVMGWSGEEGRADVPL